ncbi:contractile injection system tape measure protein [Sphingomonas sp. LB-2]|uniref:contractile injection system tape measure protein n=1 Tax=Sphingomonas caeni TaxID=2984949 RepID=UPI0022327F85|nr:contractile injection system tape measure protein [Sphingomonas caeni]MCW3849029.1 contractile injection system tape measure protein [Sphingomonas caeni]
MPAPHRIGRLLIEAETGDLDTAPALRDRIQALTRDAIPAALERAFDALGLGDLHLRIDRLDLDLGEVRIETLEADILAALDRAIGPALKAGKRLAADKAEIQTLRDYLATGVTPAFGGSDFDPAARLRALQTRDPAAFARLARAASRRGTARRRLATLGHGAMPRGEARPRDSAPGHPLYIANAGLVLLNPYLPALFERLNLPNPEGRIIGLAAASRAVHLLQYCATGRLDTPEPALALNKLLAGLPLDTPVAPHIAPSQADLETCDSLLAAMIANWPAIRGTSADGLRETFLQREGRLDRTDTGWRLTVQRKGLDVLVDQLPWSIAVVFHRWMPAPIHTRW